MTARLWLVRHGQTAWNCEGRYTGHTDLSLNAAGLEQAGLLAERLAGERFAAVYSSDLLRARQTAAAVAARLGLPVQLDARLREVLQGEWEGMLVGDIRARYAAELQRWRADPVQARPPGGESVGEVEVRVSAAANDIARAYPGQNVLVISHGLTIATLIAKARGLPLTQVFDFAPPNIEPVVIEWEGE